MHRRGVATLAVVLVVLSAGCLAGGTGPTNPPDGPADERVTDRPPGAGADGGGPTTVAEPTDLRVLNHTFRQSALGEVVLNLSVRNDASDPRRAQLVGAIGYNGSERRAFRQVVLDPGEARSVELAFDVPWESFDGNLTEARALWTSAVTTDGG